MRKIGYLFLFFFGLISLTGSAKAQDLIYTKSKEAINCKITKVGGGKIYFAVANEGVLTKSHLSLDSVNHFEYNYFYDETAKETQKLVGKPKYQPLLFSANVGFGYKFSDLPKGLTSNQIKMYNSTRPGLSWGLDAAYFLNPHWGFGAKYQQFNTWDSFIWDSTGEDISHHTRTIFIGPSCHWQTPLDKNTKNILRATLAIGYISYLEKYTFPNSTFNSIDGQSFGVVIEMGYDVKLSKSVGLGFSLGYTGGVIKYLNVKSPFINNGQGIDDDVNLGRINATIALRLYK